MLHLQPAAPGLPLLSPRVPDGHLRWVSWDSEGGHLPIQGMYQPHQNSGQFPAGPTMLPKLCIPGCGPGPQMRAVAKVPSLLGMLWGHC